MPDIIIRSTIISGFPGETNEDFEAMLNTLKTLKIDRLGVFTYSLEEGTAAARLPEQIPEAVKIERQEKTLQMQQNISIAHNEGIR